MSAIDPFLPLGEWQLSTHCGHSNNSSANS
jgi:hypothetical protein